ncbi:hypothetical protein FHW69_003307 [Luteibacter sp. Sphag1AF]|uniref:hypothetical protein n=1 Tax=Luteibacter sp. Sphag1AF TaxID=2587031 RepID=UPI001622804F|nr:hypothetical protein [Luteibacter sp. Sphag1AF]MBB3228665.1 hypothetical protein [Luteibacter sp. Sphag1AF]
MSLQPMRGAIYIAIATLLCLLSGGCHTTAQNLAPPGEVARHRPNRFPLTFTRHNFSAYCFSTWGCKVIYDDMYDVKDRDDVLSSPLRGPLHLQQLNTVNLSIENFPSPAVVTWRSRDGVPHEDSIDLDRVFRDRRIVHRIDEKKISDTAFIGYPDILLIVDDRALSIYMKTYLPLKKLRDPANRYSGMSESFVLIYAKTY